MNKKSQITMFVILGLVILIIFIIVIALKNAVKPKDDPVNRILNELEQGSIKNHITNCIIQTSMNGIEKLGANGGLIYEYEGGAVPIGAFKSGNDYLNFTHSTTEKKYFVDYVLLENTLCDQVNYSIPEYPYPDSNFSQLNTFYRPCLYVSNYAAWDGFFGQNNMSKLCYIARESSCQGFARGDEGGFTLQEQLEDYINNTLNSCINLTAFEIRLDVKSITFESVPVIEATIHDSEIWVVVRYPVRVEFENHEPLSKIINYQTNLPLRFGKLYNFFSNLLSRDSRIIDFNISSSFISANYYEDGFLVNRRFDVCPNCEREYTYDDIIEITDSESRVNGRALLFRGAIRNRRPGLDYIEDLVVDVAKTNWINLPLNGSDPDDSGVQYIFMSQGPGAGWRESDFDILSNLQRSVLRFPISRADFGTHEVGIIVVDNSGFFDYQWFHINITESGEQFGPSDSCIHDCIHHACNTYASEQAMCVHCDEIECNMTRIRRMNNYENKNPYKDCIVWCTRSANQCRSVCKGGEFEGTGGGRPWSHMCCGGACGSCVRPIMHSGDREKHVNCEEREMQYEARCLQYMPDCFWVEEEHDGYGGFCYNDTTLNKSKHIAYLIPET